jgi:hypothetical protein
LCLVYRANRDGYLMLRYEMAAIGGCMLIEGTEKHRDIFGQTGVAVIYPPTFRRRSNAPEHCLGMLATARCSGCRHVNEFEQAVTHIHDSLSSILNARSSGHRLPIKPIFLSLRFCLVERFTDKTIAL